MRTCAENGVRILGLPPWQDMDCSHEPLTDQMKVLLWFIDGAERRRSIALEWSSQHQRFRRDRRLLLRR